MIALKQLVRRHGGRSAVLGGGRRGFAKKDDSSPDSVTGAPKTGEAGTSDAIGEEMRADTFVMTDTEVHKDEDEDAGLVDAAKNAARKVKSATVDKVKDAFAGSSSEDDDDKGKKLGSKPVVSS